ncbi:MAG: ABC transporter permease [Nitrolancea sp.]
METTELMHRSTSEPRRLPNSLRTLLLIARRGALEALRDRMTLMMSLFFSIVFPIFMVATTVVPAAHKSGSDAESTLKGVLAIYLLIIGLMPSTAAVGIASGQFAGEKEQGNLTPLLATPASNFAIFGGKVIGAILPSIIFSAIAELIYVLSIILLTGVHTLGLLSLWMALAMVALVPATSLFAVTVASMISSRVRTFNTAQQVSGFALLPLWGIIIGLGYELQHNGLVLAVFVASLFIIDVVMTYVAASTWSREEVLAKL